MKNCTKMFYLCLAFVLIVPSTQVLAENIWELWNGSDEEVKSYLLKNSIEYGPTVGSAWFVMDHKTPRTRTYRTPQGVVTKTVEYTSFRYLLVINCNELTTYIKETNYYSKNIGTGTIVDSESDYYGRDTTTYAPDDWSNGGFNRFCGKTWKAWKYIN